MLAVARVGGTAVDVDQNIEPSGTVQVFSEDLSRVVGLPTPGRPRHVDGINAFRCATTPKPSKRHASASPPLAGSRSPCAPHAQTTRHNQPDHVAVLSTVTSGLALDRRQQQ